MAADPVENLVFYLCVALDCLIMYVEFSHLSGCKLTSCSQTIFTGIQSKLSSFRNNTGMPLVARGKGARGPLQDTVNSTSHAIYGEDGTLKKVDQFINKDMQTINNDDKAPWRRSIVTSWSRVTKSS
jgi:hypothetical protein